MAIIRDRYYPLLFDEGKLAVADEIIDEEFVNHRHPKDWPTGPEALKKVVRELNAMHGGGLNNLHTEVVEIFVRGHNEIYALTHQTGVHNGNDVMQSNCTIGNLTTERTKSVRTKSNSGQPRTTESSYAPLTIKRKEVSYRLYHLERCNCQQPRHRNRSCPR